MTKKSFTSELGAGIAAAPAMAFISTAPATVPAPSGAVAEAAPAAGSDRKETAPAKEAKTRRLHSLIRPSLHAWLTAAAAREGISPNDKLNRILEAAKEAEEVRT